MQISTLFIIVLALSLLSYYVGLKRGQKSRSQAQLLSLPTHYGYLSAMWSALPAVLILLAWSIFEPGYLDQQILNSFPASVLNQSEVSLQLLVNQVHLAISNGTNPDDPVLLNAISAYNEARQNSRVLITVLVVAIGLGVIVFALSKYLTVVHARKKLESVTKIFLMLCSGVAIVTTLGIVLSVLFEALRFFESVPIVDFMFGTSWSPQTAIREDQVGSSGSFGAVPLFLGTVLISLIAMLIAVPVGLMTAIYLSEYASRKFRSIAKPDVN